MRSQSRKQRRQVGRRCDRCRCGHDWIVGDRQIRTRDRGDAGDECVDDRVLTDVAGVSSESRNQLLENRERVIGLRRRRGDGVQEGLVQHVGGIGTRRQRDCGDLDIGTRDQDRIGHDDTGSHHGHPSRDNRTNRAAHCPHPPSYRLELSIPEKKLRSAGRTPLARCPLPRREGAPMPCVVATYLAAAALAAAACRPTAAAAFLAGAEALAAAAGATTERVAATGDGGRGAGFRVCRAAVTSPTNA